MTVISSQAIDAVAPPGTGAEFVTVETGGGTSTTSSAAQFTYENLPTVRSITPAVGPSLGGTVIDIAGTGFTSDSLVQFASTTAPSVGINSEEIEAVAPPGADAEDVTVTTEGGTSATNAADQFTYQNETQVSVASSISPSILGQSVALSATVSPSDGGGSVGFFADGSTSPISGCGSASLALVNGNYVATCSTSAFAVGSHAIVADYSGDTGYEASSGTLSPDQIVDPTAPPVITSTGSDMVPAGTAFSYPVTTTGTPTAAISLASGSTLPSGVTLTDNGNGTATLTGSATVAAGVYSFSIQAINGVTPDATEPFTLTVTEPPVITSTGSDMVPAGTAFSYPVTTTGTPTAAISLASGSTLPSGVTLTDNGNGTATLTGSATVAAGVYSFSIQAINGVTPDATEPFTLTVESAAQQISLQIKGLLGTSTPERSPREGSPWPRRAVRSHL